ncbi:MAG: hypothetical protein SNJ33_02840 [Rikenellaceae bacterium]
MDKYREQPRDWSDTLQDRVRDVSTPPSDNLWDKIEASLDIAAATSSESVVHSNQSWRWWSSGAAAAVAILLVILSLEQPSTNQQNIISAISNIAQESINDIQEEIQEEITPNPAITSPKKEVATERRVAIVQKQTPQTESVTEVEQSDDSTIETPIEKSAKDEPKQESKPRTISDAVAYNYRDIEPQDYHNRKRGGRTTLSISGSSGVTSQLHEGSSTTPVQASAYDVLLDSQDDEESLLKSQTNYDAIHYQPFSLGVRVQGYLTQHLRLMSGVNYTQAISKVRFSSNSSTIESQQQLHFIGVPIRLDYQFLTKSRFSLYAGAGGAIEYCIAAKLDDKRVEEKSLHYSTNITFGAEYKVNRWLGVYFEPEINYYITSTKLESLRNDTPLSVNLRLGLSFTL